MRLLVALACLGISISIGLTYARDIWVNGWQLWTWAAACIILAAVFLMNSGRPPINRSRKIWLWPLLLVLLALLLRVPFLETIPGGLHVDEVGIADFSLRHVFPQPGQTINPFRTGPSSQPTIYHYLLRLSLALAGKSIFGLRLSSALAGAAAVLATYWLVEVLHNRRVALITAVIMTTYHFHIHWSRIGLNNIWDTFWIPLMLAPFAWGWKKHWSGGAIFSGIAVGLSQYFYAGSRLGLLLLAFLILQLFRETRRQSTSQMQVSDQSQFTVHNSQFIFYSLKMALVALCIAAPLFLYALRDPVPFFDRSRMVWGWQPNAILLAMGDSRDWLGYAWRQLWRSAGAFTAVPDVTGFYGPGVPLLIGLSGPLFVIGLFWAIYKKHWLPVLWIVLTVFLGGFLLSDPPGSSHYVVAIPAICWLVAMPLDWLVSINRRRLAVILLAAVIALDLYFYFFIYVPSPPRDLIHTFPTL